MTGIKDPPDQVANAIIKSMAFLDMVRASDHYCGKGMSQGTHFPATLPPLGRLTPLTMLTNVYWKILFLLTAGQQKEYTQLTPIFPAFVPGVACMSSHLYIVTGPVQRMPILVIAM